MEGETYNNNLAPSDDNGWYAEKDARDIENEKIKALFDGARFGTSADDKALKVAVLNKIFGTTSATEIEKMKSVKLKSCRENLEVVLMDLSLLNTQQEKLDYIKELVF